MNIFHLFYVMSTLNSAIDSGRFAGITVEDICRHIEQGDLISYLEVRLGQRANFKLFEICPDYEKAFTLKLQAMLPVFKGRIEHKLGIQNSGLCFLIALIIQVIQDHALKKVEYNPCLAENIIPLQRTVGDLQVR
jgi:hypothetical protein